MTPREKVLEFLKGCSVGPAGACDECVDGLIAALPRNDPDDHVATTQISRVRDATDRVDTKIAALKEQLYS